jgi:hypothetical protein
MKFYDYSRAFASMGKAFTGTRHKRLRASARRHAPCHALNCYGFTDECPQGEGFLRNAARALRARAPVMFVTAHLAVSNARLKSKARHKSASGAFPLWTNS